MAEQLVRVIVTLELPPNATDAEFAAARGAVLAVLNDITYTVVRNYPRTGQLLIELQADDLAILNGAPGVRSVNKDRLLRPQSPQHEER